MSDLEGVKLAGPDFAFPMDTAPKDGSILRLLVKFDRKSAAGAFEDTTEPSWTIGTNNMANTGEDQWDIVGWSWEQDVFCHAYGATAIGWLPFHAESTDPVALPSPVLAPLPGSGETKSNYPEIPDGWRGIASAPKDGTYILAYPVLNQTACVVVWEPAIQTPPMMRAKGENIDHSGYWRLPMTGKPTPYHPTHWQSLPTNPVETQAVEVGK